MKVGSGDADLLAEYIAAFAQLDDLTNFAVAPGLRVKTYTDGLEDWQPRQVTTPRYALEALYGGLGFPGRGSTRFPPLYESLVLSYRWVEVDLGSYRLLPNESAEDLSPLLAALRADRHLYETLVPNGYIQFGRGSGGDYDPICFDFRQRQR